VKEIRADMNRLSGIEELELVHQVVHGDHEAFRFLVLSYESSLLMYLKGLLGNLEDARDIAQETFVAAFYALPRWKSPISKDMSGDVRGKEIDDSSGCTYVEAHPLAPWLYRIATNRALTFLKTRSANMNLVLAEFEDQRQTNQKETRISQSVNNMTLEDCYVARELLREALSCLSEEDAVCVVLRFVLKEQYSEIAERLGLTKEAIRKRVARGLVTLRSAYKTLEEVPQ
jgi:RNA polymerase sigma-70 factor (ECF subfamily)